MDITIPVWLVTIVSLVATTTVSTIVGLIVKNIFKNYIANKEQADKTQRDKELELLALKDKEAREERQTCMIQTIGECIKPIEDKIDQLSDKLDKDNAGTLATLRNAILTCYYRCVKKGYRNDYDYTNVHDLFDAYSDLKGNSFVRDVMERFDKLPTKEEYKKAHPIEWENKVKSGELIDCSHDIEVN